MRIAIHDYAGHPFQIDLSKALARLGHEVRHFYFGADPGPKGDQARRVGDPPGFSIEAIQIPFAYSKEKMLHRFLGDHFYAAAAARAMTAFRPDIIVSGNAPIDVQRALRITSHRCGAAFVFWVQDFYGLAMQKLLARHWLGVGRLIAHWYRAVENRTLVKSDAVILISPGFARYLPASLAKTERVHVLRNWGSLDLITPRDRDNLWREKLGLGQKFIFMYTGTLALKHNPRLLLALADAFAETENVAIVVVAAGVNAHWLAQEQARHPRDNLVLLPLQPAAELADVLATADTLLVFLEENAGEFAVPSKLLNYLCAGRPILLWAPASNLAATIMAESGAGLTLPPDDVAGFLAAARQFYHDDLARLALGRSGRAYAEKHFAIQEIAGQFESLFSRTLQRSSPPASAKPSWVFGPGKKQSV